VGARAFSARLLSVGLICLLVLAFLTTTTVEASGRSGGSDNVSWDPSRLDVEVVPAGMVGAEVSVTLPTALEDVHLRVTPSLDGIAAFTTSELERVEAGTYVFSVALGAPEDARVGRSYGGTIHLRAGDRTIAPPLQVRVRVVAPSPGAEANEILQPAPARLMETGFGWVVADEVLVGPDPDDSDPEATVRAVAQRHGAELIGAARGVGVFQMRIPRATGLSELRAAWEAFEADEAVAYAGPHLIGQVADVRLPNDPEYDSWDEDNPAGNNFHFEAIRAPSAWAQETGSADVPVAIIDKDFDPEHEDLTFASVSGARHSGYGHGTHVAGLACADGNNGIGVAGVAWRCDLRAYEIGSPHHEAAIDLLLGAEAMVEAVRDGARVVNMSWGVGPPCELWDAIPEARETAEASRRLFMRAASQAERHADALWVAAAGNSACGDEDLYTPANLTHNFPTSFVSVGATDRDGQLSSFSNFTASTTLAAPGGREGGFFGIGKQEIFSTLPTSCRLFGWFCGSRYGGMMGTSQAAPQVAGTTALMFSARPSLTVAQARQCLIRSTQDGRQVPGQDFHEINAAEALACAKRIGDEPELDLPPTVDLVFAMDLTGSMGGVLNTVKSETSDVLANLRDRAPATDFRFGVVSFEDYPGRYDSRGCGSTYAATYGSAQDEPFRIDESLAASSEDIDAAVNAMSLGDGGDLPESYGRVLWELGQSDTADELGWRDDALKLVVMFGDDVPHDTDLHRGFPAENVPTIPRDTGVDPGRSGNVDCGGDDIDFYDDALATMQSEEIRLLFVNNSRRAAYQEAWAFWAAETGGAAIQIDNRGVVGERGLTGIIVDLIVAADT
jgi:subtilisin family serine protease